MLARGVVLCGLSAGSLCWFEDAVTAFHGGPQTVPGLGLLPFSNCVHLNDEERRAAFREAVASGAIGPALRRRGRLAEVVRRGRTRRGRAASTSSRRAAAYLGARVALAA